MSRDRYRRIQRIDKDAARLRRTITQVDGELRGKTLTSVADRRDAYAVRAYATTQLQELARERDALTQEIAAVAAHGATKWDTPTGTDGTDHRPGPQAPPNRSIEEL